MRANLDRFPSTSDLLAGLSTEEASLLVASPALHDPHATRAAASLVLERALALCPTSPALWFALGCVSPTLRVQEGALSR